MFFGCVGSFGLSGVRLGAGHGVTVASRTSRGWGVVGVGLNTLVLQGRRGERAGMGKTRLGVSGPVPRGERREREEKCGRFLGDFGVEERGKKGFFG